jgi:hypothetical protein
MTYFTNPSVLTYIMSADFPVLKKVELNIKFWLAVPEISYQIKLYYSRFQESEICYG